MNPIIGDRISGVEQGIALAVILRGPLVQGAAKVGKGAIHTGKEMLGQVKNVLHPDKVKGIANKVFNDYIKSPLQKGYTYFKDYTKKLGDVKTSLTYEAATPLGSIKVPKTVSEVTQDLKESVVQMAKELDEKIGGKDSSEPKYVPKDSNGKKLGLPRNEGGKLVNGTSHKPESMYPHTQIGIKKGRNGEYIQTLEWDTNGKPIQRTDWTDHGRGDHVNPHSHEAVFKDGSWSFKE